MKKLKIVKLKFKEIGFKGWDNDKINLSRSKFQLYVAVIEEIMGHGDKVKLIFCDLKYSKLASRIFPKDTNGKLVKGEDGIYVVSSIKFLWMCVFILVREYFFS